MKISKSYLNKVVGNYLRVKEIQEIMDKTKLKECYGLRTKRGRMERTALYKIKEEEEL